MYHMTNGNEPTLKEDLASLRDDLKSMAERVLQSLREIKTDILQEVFRVAKTSNQRLTLLEKNQVALITRLELMERRLDDLERTYGFPTQRIQ